MWLTDGSHDTVLANQGQKMGAKHHARWEYGTATARASVDSGISTVLISGVVTPAVAGQILIDNASWLHKTGAAGQVADYSSSLMCIDAHSLLSHARSAAAGYGALATPTALIVSRDSLAMFDTYCGLMAEHGVGRSAFLGRQQAHGWVKAWAPLWAAHFAERGLLRARLTPATTPPVDPSVSSQTTAPAPRRRSGRSPA